MKMIYVAIKIAKVSTWFITIASVAGFGVAAYLYYKDKNKTSITPEKEVDSIVEEARKSGVSMIGPNNVENAYINKEIMNGQFEKY